MCSVGALGLKFKVVFQYHKSLECTCGSKPFLCRLQQITFFHLHSNSYYMPSRDIHMNFLCQITVKTIWRLCWDFTMIISTHPNTWRYASRWYVMIPNNLPTQLMFFFSFSPSECKWIPRHFGNKINQVSLWKYCLGDNSCVF